MEFPFPPLPEQEHFARVVRRALCRVYRDIEALRGRQGESARQGETLFQSMLAQSFGEGLHEAFNA